MINGIRINSIYGVYRIHLKRNVNIFSIVETDICRMLVDETN